MCISFLRGSHKHSVSCELDFVYFLCYLFKRKPQYIANNICSQGFNDLNLDDTDFQVFLSKKFQFINSYIKSKKIKIKNKMSVLMLTSSKIKYII